MSNTTVGGKKQIVQAFYKWNTPRARWQEVDVVLVHMFSPNYARKYILADGTEVIRKQGEELFNDDGLIEGVDD